MTHRTTLATATGVLLLGAWMYFAAPPAGAQTGREAAWSERTSWGDPDLAGIYSNDDETGTPMERPDEFEGLTLATITPVRPTGPRTSISR